MNLTSLIRRRHGAPHWYVQRATAVLALPITLILILTASSALKEGATISFMLSQIVSEYPTLTLITAILLAWHMKSGFESIFDDYIHDETSKLACVIALRITILLLLKYVYLFAYF